MVNGKLERNYAVIHHSKTKDEGKFAWTAIRKYHIEVNGWRDIGYTFGILRVGPYIEVVLGRMPDEVGAHCPQAMMNKRAFGICFVGDFDLAPPDIDIWEKGLDFCHWLMETNPIPANHFIGHREAQAMGGLAPEERKSCPGNMFPMDKFRAALGA